MTFDKLHELVYVLLQRKSQLLVFELKKRNREQTVSFLSFSESQPLLQWIKR